jgi:hypothetical protein
MLVVSMSDRHRVRLGISLTHISLKKEFHHEEEEPDSNRESNHRSAQERNAKAAIDRIDPQRILHPN